MSSSRREIAVLGAAALIAAALPALAAHHLGARLDDDLCPALADALGTSVSVGDAEASLTGSFRLSELRVGGLLRADAIEAGVSLRSLLSGSLRADEIRVAGPRLTVHADTSGYSNLERVIEHALQNRRRAGGGGPRAPRRIVVTGGDLVVDLGARGTVRAGGLELWPRPGGVRAVAGDVALDLHHDPFAIVGRFGRAAADLELGDRARLRRFLADGGRLDIEGEGGARLILDPALVSGGDLDLELRAGIAGAAGSSLRIALGEGGGRGAELDVELEAVPLGILAGIVPSWVDLGRASAAGRGSVALDTGRFEVDLNLAGAAVDHRRLAGAPVAIDGAVTAAGTAKDRGVELDRASLRRGDLELTLSGAAELAPDGSVARVRARLELSPVECGAALASLPAAVREPLVGLTAHGLLAGALELAFDAAAPGDTELRGGLDLDACEVDGEAAGADPRDFRRGGEITLPDGRTRRFDARDPHFVALDSLPAHVPGAFVASEDARFFVHDGFDRHQIQRSLSIDLAAGKLVRGGSTISQQLAKNLFLHHDRTLVRKLQEAVLTWRLERVLGKPRMLELYLSLIELSDEDHYGIEEAAQRWFGVAAAKLGVRQAAFLAALTSEPTSMSRRIHAAGALDPESARRVDLVLRAMKRAHVVTPATYRRAQRQPLDLHP